MTLKSNHSEQPATVKARSLLRVFFIHCYCSGAKSAPLLTGARATTSEFSRATEATLTGRRQELSGTPTWRLRASVPLELLQRHS